MASDTMKLERAEELLRGFSSKRILVIGDLMLDEFVWGRVSRISPEAPVPVVEVIRESYYPGGAANVALYILSLVQLVELPGRPNCTSRFLATLRARVERTSVPAQSSRPELGQSHVLFSHKSSRKGSILRDTAANENSLLWAIRSNACQFPERGPKDPLRPLRRSTNGRAAGAVLPFE